MRRSIINLLTVFTLIGCGSGSARSDLADINSPDSNLSLGGETRHSAAVGLQGVQPYRSDGPYAVQLRRCALAEGELQSCAFTDLPMLGMQHVYPAIDDIMDRVLVSHQWMGQRFEEALHELPVDVRVLMKPITAIVLAEDIRPSYYRSVTSTLYLDGYHFWLSSDEKSTFADLLISGDSSKAAGSLPFHAWWRYVKEDDFAYRLWGDWAADKRDIEQTVLPLAATLFHELAHANDYFPPEYLQTIDLEWTVAEARAHLQSQRVSEALYRRAPLNSPLLERIAGAIHLNVELTGDDATLTADDVGLAFQMGIASDDYAYISRFEDVAMLFEEAMMVRHFEVLRDVAYVHLPSDESDPGCDDYLVAWGMRNRIADARVRPRALQVAQAILPSHQWQSFFDELPPAQFLTFGSGWCQSLIVGNDAAAAASPVDGDFAKSGFSPRRFRNSAR